MVNVEMTSHLYRFFPQFEGLEIAVPAGSVAQVLIELDKIAKGFSDFIVDEHGALRGHVVISVNRKMVIDRKTLSDHVPENATVHILQALTGG